MLKKMLGAAAMALCAVAAQAAPQEYEWTYTGFADLDNWWWKPDVTVSGRFVVDDRNANGTYDLSEVTSFDYDGFDMSTCGGARECDLLKFSYDPAGALSFDFYASESFEMFGGANWHITTGQSWGRAVTYPTDSYFKIYLWDPRTTLSIAPVPEPQTWLMLGVGLLALGARARSKALAACRT
ncbi:PEP-CTERM sorting domain-containing protein [Massilia sp. CCM 8734]|uniref:PEP-CTERM sorting domain-containing protein n=1 Tax=Massilia sp. CCM 8734 TaxID=2609283 RepID=UPI0014239076|nr:PEP-CTERM sorting domain-containing protein [Massilia sp. CCM 8734]